MVLVRDTFEYEVVSDGDGVGARNTWVRGSE